MAYDPTTDFLALARLAGGVVSFGKMPGLDFMVYAMKRAGLIQLSVGQSAPLSDQAATVWLKPSVPSWTAEGVVFLWNGDTLAYEAATPALWAQYLNPTGGNKFQAGLAAAVVVQNATTLFAIERDNPAVTALQLPSVLTRGGKPLAIADWSINVAAHQIVLTPFAGQTIMTRATFNLFSTADQLAGITLQPSPDLLGWVIAP